MPAPQATQTIQPTATASQPVSEQQSLLNTDKMPNKPAISEISGAAVFAQANHDRQTSGAPATKDLKTRVIEA